jgi:outer membrane protein assembly factor BamA
LRLEESAATLAAACEQAGYPDVIVRRADSWNDAKTLVDVRFEIDAGTRVVVDRVILHGIRRSEPSWVRRASGLEPGAALSRDALLAAERRLFRLGVFSEVDVEPSARTQDGSRRDIVVRLREGRTQRVTYGIGYDSEDGLGALVGYSHGHVAGRGYQLQVDGRASESTHRFRLIARRPELGRRQPFAAAFTAFAEQEDRPGFTVERQGGRFELERRWRALDASVGFDYRRVDLLELIGGSGTDADRDLQDIDIASVIGQATWDGRDDPVDATRGFSTSLVVQQAFPLFTAEEDFLKVFAQQTAQVRLGRLGVLAASLRFGGIEPNADRDIPVAERLYAGGRTTHRAFRRDRLGVPGVTLSDTGSPLGGNGLALVNVDWRFPLVAGVGGIVFVDGGNVWANWRDANLDEVRWGAGIGVRYISPIGPLRLEVGWPFEPEVFEDEYVVSFSFGNAF